MWCQIRRISQYSRNKFVFFRSECLEDDDVISLLVIFTGGRHLEELDNYSCRFHLIYLMTFIIWIIMECNSWTFSMDALRVISFRFWRCFCRTGNIFRILCNFSSILRRSPFWNRLQHVHWSFYNFNYNGYFIKMWPFTRFIKGGSD